MVKKDVGNVNFISERFTVRDMPAVSGCVLLCPDEGKHRVTTITYSQSVGIQHTRAALFTGCTQSTTTGIAHLHPCGNMLPP